MPWSRRTEQNTSWSCGAVWAHSDQQKASKTFPCSVLRTPFSASFDCASMQRLGTCLIWQRFSCWLILRHRCSWLFPFRFVSVLLPLRVNSINHPSSLRAIGRSKTSSNQTASFPKMPASHPITCLHSMKELFDPIRQLHSQKESALLQWKLAVEPCHSCARPPFLRKKNGTTNNGHHGRSTHKFHCCLFNQAANSLQQEVTHAAKISVASRGTSWRDVNFTGDSCRLLS
jgi:hypothetical protein